MNRTARKDQNSAGNIKSTAPYSALGQMLKGWALKGAESLSAVALPSAAHATALGKQCLTRCLSFPQQTLVSVSSHQHPRSSTASLALSQYHPLPSQGVPNLLDCCASQAFLWNLSGSLQDPVTHACLCLQNQHRWHQCAASSRSIQESLGQ